ncbi:MAG: divalent-cation tolerance protein CutA [Acidimicrobiales bacterium]
MTAAGEEPETRAAQSPAQPDFPPDRGEDLCEVVVTAPDAQWLASFARSLVEDRVCACGHVIDVIRSIYRWQGRVHDEAEARVALHTRLELVPEIVRRARAQHPYEVPAVIALPMAGGSPEYLRWVREETAETGGESGER